MVYNLWKVQERFEVDIKELPEQIDTSTYSKLCCFVLIEGYISAVIFVFCNVALHASCIVIVSAIVSERLAIAAMHSHCASTEKNRAG
jgi:hypothetical protein